MINLRWVYGKFKSAREAGEVYAELVAYTRGDSEMGIDYSTAADGVSQDRIASKGGDPKSDARSRMMHLRSIFEAAPDPCWYLSRVGGEHIEKIARDHNIPVDAVKRSVYDTDALLETKLKNQGLLK